jgi:DNA-directed RNA polymerase subunit RPC12/RpoP
MIVSLENLYHFNCDSCKKWWSIGDAPKDLQTRNWFCPYCGFSQVIEKILP